jgi:hypothetical protein
VDGNALTVTSQLGHYQSGTVSIERHMNFTPALNGTGQC